MLKDRDSVLWDTSLVQPYASIWSVWLHFLYINVDIYSDLFGRRGLFPDQIKSGKGTAYNRYGLEGLSAGLEEWIHDFLEVDETSAVPRFRSYTRSDEGFSTGSRSLMDGFVHICPPPSIRDDNFLKRFRQIPFTGGAHTADRLQIRDRSL